MELSKRLGKVASLVTEGNFLVDVGTDHGYLPVYLVKMGKIPAALAMDVNQGPLSRAREHIADYGLDEFIQVRLSNGLENLQPEEGGTLVIAGMGGSLMLRILQEGEEKLHNFSEFILQPQSELALFRKGIQQLGLQVVEEAMILEDGKYYPMMKAVFGTDFYEKDIEYEYGRILLKNRDEVLKRFLEKEEVLYTELAEKLKQQLSVKETEALEKRLAEVNDKLLQIREGVNLWGQKW